MNNFFSASQKLLIAIFIIFPVEQSVAQLKVDAQYRPRIEVRNGYRELIPEGTAPSIIASQRMRLSFVYETDNLKLKFSPQDVRVWGDENLTSSTGVYGNDASLDLFEGYVELKPTSSLRLSIGRQTLVYDNQRLLAMRNWNQNGLAYDALVLKWKREKWDVHVGTSWNSLDATTSNNTYPTKRIKSLNFVWLGREFTDNLKFSFLHIASGVTETDTTNTLHFRQTSGVYFNYNSNVVKAKTNIYFQYGNNNRGQKVSAFLADADIMLNTGRLTPGIGISYLSGNNDINGGTDHLFDVLYGARHRFFGHMDYFRNMPSHTNGGGLTDLYGYLNLEVSEKLRLKNTGHFFSLAQTNENTPSDKYLGYENEVELKYQINNWGALKAAWLFYLTTDSFEQIQSINDPASPQFFYVSLTVNTNIFKEKY
jgi:hypothetical protein